MNWGQFYLQTAVTVVGTSGGKHKQPRSSEELVFPSEYNFWVGTEKKNLDTNKCKIRAEIFTFVKKTRLCALLQLWSYHICVHNALPRVHMLL